MLSRLRGHVRHNVVGYIAVFIALSGTAYAAKPMITGADVQDESLTGADVLNESLTGNDVQNDSLKGADVDESSLGKVGDADTLDGLDSTAFASGTQKLDTRIVTPRIGDQTTETVVELGGLKLEAFCFQDGSEQNLILWASTTGSNARIFWQFVLKFSGGATAGATAGNADLTGARFNLIGRSLGVGETLTGVGVITYRDDQGTVSLQFGYDLAFNTHSCEVSGTALRAT